MDSHPVVRCLWLTMISSFRRARHVRKKLLSLPCCPAQTGWTVGTQGYVYVLVGQKAANGARRALAIHLAEPGKLGDLGEPNFMAPNPKLRSGSFGVQTVSFFAPEITAEEVTAVCITM